MVLTLGLGLAVLPWSRAPEHTLRVSSQRIRIQRGTLLRPFKDSIEVFRIDHFDLHKPLGMRLLGNCLLHLRSSDASFGTVILYGVPNLEQLAESLRECSLRERARRKVTTFVEA